MNKEKEAELTTLIVPTEIKKNLSVALHEVVGLAPHGVISKNTLSTIKKLQAALRSNQHSKLPKTNSTSLKL